MISSLQQVALQESCFFPTREGYPSICFTLQSGWGSRLHPNKQSDPGKVRCAFTVTFLVLSFFSYHSKYLKNWLYFSKYFCCSSYNSIKEHRHCKKQNQTQTSVKCPLLSNPDMNNNCQYVIKSCMSLIAISWCPLQTCSRAHGCSQLSHRAQGFQRPWEGISLAFKAMHERREDIKSNS